MMKPNPNPSNPWIIVAEIIQGIFYVLLAALVILGLVSLCLWASDSHDYYPQITVSEMQVSSINNNSSSLPLTQVISMNLTFQSKYTISNYFSKGAVSVYYNNSLLSKASFSPFTVNYPKVTANVQAQITVNPPLHALHFVFDLWVYVDAAIKKFAGGTEDVKSSLMLECKNVQVGGSTMSLLSPPQCRYHY